jgi:hypothetical protein
MTGTEARLSPMCPPTTTGYDGDGGGSVPGVSPLVRASGIARVGGS